jgi:DNA-binding FrmR family transcriptional regulator
MTLPPSPEAQIDVQAIKARCAETRAQARTRRAKLRGHVAAIQRAVEAQLPEDEPDCVHVWVYETAVEVMVDRLRGTVAAKTLSGSVGHVLDDAASSDDIARELREQRDALTAALAEARKERDEANRKLLAHLDDAIRRTP